MQKCELCENDALFVCENAQLLSGGGILNKKKHAEMSCQLGQGRPPAHFLTHTHTQPF